MGELIQFPARHTENYQPLLHAIKRMDSKTDLTKMLYSLQQDGEDRLGLTPKETADLIDAGRQRRIDLANKPKPRRAAVDGPGVYCYTPEMGELPPDCQMEAQLSHYGKHYYVDTPLELKGRGITKLPDPHWYKGSKKDLEHWNSYRVTYRAFEKLKREHAIAIERPLD